MKRLFYLIFFWLPIGLFSQNLSPTGFELDGNMYTDFPSSQGTHDWFTTNPNGVQLFDPSQVDSLVRVLNAANSLSQRNLSFHLRGKNLPTSSSVLDVLYQRDYISAANARDASTFITGASKNADHPQSWDVSSPGSPQKGDLVEIMALLKRDEFSQDKDLWFMGAASTLTTNGDKHIDFEFYRKELRFDNQAFQTQGIDGGRTAWIFGPQGETYQAGDLIVSLDYVNGGKQIESSIRIWVDPSSFPNRDLTARNPQLSFDLTGVFNSGVNSGGFGYAEIVLADGNSALIVRNNTANTQAAPWGTLNGPQAKLATEYIPMQWVEIGLNLSALGLDPSRYEGSTCAAPLGTVLVKSRASHSFTAQLKDFVIPMSFGNEAEWDLDVNIPDLSCLQEQVIPSLGSLPTDLIYLWEGPNSFYSEEATPSINTAGTYIVTAGIAQGCVLKDTIVVGEDRETPDLQLRGGTLSCELTSLEISASSSTLNTSIKWRGPNGQTANGNTWSIDEAGWYFATATHPRSGCQTIDSVEVLLNNFTPEIYTQNLSLNCFQASDQPIVNLSQTGNYQYSWTGPNGFSSTELRPSMSLAGTYTLTVTVPANACQSEATLEVFTDFAEPVLSFQNDTITCQDTEIQLTGNIQAGTDYQTLWTGPGGFSSTDPFPTVDTEGTYQLVVTNNENGCSSNTSLTIIDKQVFENFRLQGGEISCLNDSVLLTAGLDGNGYTYQWTGPGGFSSTSEEVYVKESGTYTLNVSHANGCSMLGSVAVTSSKNIPKVNLPESLDLTCVRSSWRPSGLSGTYRYQWTGDNGYTSTSSSPNIDRAGTYTLIVSDPNSGCDTSLTVVIGEDYLAPTVSITGGTLTCSTPTTELSFKVSGVSNYTFHWLLPNGLISKDSSFQVDAGGQYRLYVKNPENGCLTISSYTVRDENIPISLRATAGALTCETDSAKLQFTASPTGLFTVQWTGPNGFSSTAEEVYVTAQGTYTLTVSNPNTGCSAVDQVVVISNKNVPEVNLPDSLSLTCERSSWRPSGLPNNFRYQWAGDNGFTSTSGSPSINRAGTYTVLVSDPESDCDTTLTISIGEDFLTPTVRIQGGVLTCASPTTELSFEVSGVDSYTFQWLLPNGLISKDTSLVVETAGQYRLYVRNPENGCLAISSYTVRDENRPISLQGRGGTLTCTTDSVQLSFTTTTTGSFDIVWTGPNGFISYESSPWVSTIGSYHLQVTDTLSGCSGLLSLRVRGEYDPPVFSLRKSGDLNCQNDQVLLYAFPSNNYSFEWFKDSEIIGTAGTIAVREPGTYSVQVKNLSTGCIKIDSVEVFEHKQIPTAHIYVEDALSCFNTTVKLNIEDQDASSHSYVWSGPGGFYSTLAMPTVNRAGIYSLTIKDIESRCDTVLMIEVQGDPSPLTLTAQGGTITCINPEVNLSISYDASLPVSFSWTGPNGFVSTDSEPRVSIPGYYQLTMTDTISGCQASVYARVLDKSEVPFVKVGSGILACEGSSTQLTAQYSIGSYSFQWTGPNGFTSLRSSPIVTEAGTYVLRLSNRETGCFAIDSTAVSRMENPVSISLTSEGELSCSGSSVKLSAGNSNSNLSYLWTGPSGFISQNISATVTETGTYTLVLTDPSSGCSAIDSISISRTQNPLHFAIESEGELTCSPGSVILSVGNPDTNLSYNWTGPSGFTSSNSSPELTEPGTYKLLLMDFSTGCSAVDSIQIIRRQTPLAISIQNPGELNCVQNTLVLSIDNPSDFFSYEWVGPQGFSSQDAEPSITAAGSYALKITESMSQCLGGDTIQIKANFEAPLIALADTGLSCEHSFLLLGTDLPLDKNYQYQWEGPNNFSSSQAEITVQDPGTYVLRVLNPTNGCETLETMTVAAMPPCSDAVCTMTQGFYGNDRGRFCDGRTTREILEDVLETDLVLGSGENRFTVRLEELDAFFLRMPGGGTSQPLDGIATCENPVGIPLDNKGQFSNNLLAQTLTLGINLRLSAGLGDVILRNTRMTTMASTDCQETNAVAVSGSGRSFNLPQSVMSYLGQPSIAELYAFANAALDGSYVPQAGTPGYGEITGAIGAINDGFDKCRVVSDFDGIEEQSPQWQVSGYPNPSGGEPVSFGFTALESGEASISLHDMITGATLSIPMSEEVVRGQDYQFMIPVDELPEGTYFYLLYLDEKIVGKGNVQIYQ